MTWLHGYGLGMGQGRVEGGERGIMDKEVVWGRSGKERVIRGRCRVGHNKQGFRGRSKWV